MGEAAREETVSREAFRYCESVLYQYHLNKSKLADLHGTMVDGRKAGSRDREGYTTMGSDAGSAGFGDQVLSRVVRLVSDRELGRLERLTAAVERMYSLVTPDHRDVIHVKYWAGHDLHNRNLGHEGVWRMRNGELADLLNLSLSTFDRRRKEVVGMMALLLDV